MKDSWIHSFELNADTMLKSVEGYAQNLPRKQSLSRKSENQEFKAEPSRPLNGLSSRVFKSSRRVAEPRLLSELELHSIKTSFQMIECLWRDLSLGMDFISISMLKLIHENLGEIGSELFEKLFLTYSETKQVKSCISNCCSLFEVHLLIRLAFLFQTVSKQEFWTQWMEFLSGYSDVESSSTGDHNESQQLNLTESVKATTTSGNFSNFLDDFKARYFLHRRLRAAFFDDKTLVICSCQVHHDV